MAQRSRKAPAVRWPWDPVALEPREVSALKAMDPVAFNALLKICGADTNPYALGGDEGRRATDFGCGKLWVAGTVRGFRAVKMPGARPSGPATRAIPVDVPASGEQPG